SPLRVETNTAQSDLVTLVMESEGGMEIVFMYSTDLFDASTAERMMDEFKTVIARVSADPDIPIQNLSLFSTQQKEKIRMAKREKFVASRYGQIDLSKEELAKLGDLEPGQKLPMLVQPTMEDVDLTEWAKSNLELIEQQLRERGGILFRGFFVHSADDFARFSTSLYSRTMKYQERSTPRTLVGKDVYTSTEYPPEQSIAMHNEFSYGTTWPMKIWFFCEIAPQQGGQTPIANSSEVYRRLDPEIVESFTSKKVMYVRNYGSGIDLPWQTVFQTENRAEVEAYCRSAPIEWQWLEGDRLKTWQVREAVARHPETGEMLWFNQAHLFHLSNLAADLQQSLLETFGEENLPRHAWYGDGTPIEKEYLQEIRRVYAEVAMEFNWQHGDVLLLDNMLVAHGRRPFSGARRILVAMAEPHSVHQQQQATSMNYAV
ncbi:MAG: TauD/TfdA family dioxygenase, partial [Actinomycetota bacterium]